MPLGTPKDCTTLQKLLPCNHRQKEHPTAQKDSKQKRPVHPVAPLSGARETCPNNRPQRE